MKFKLGFFGLEGVSINPDTISNKKPSILRRLNIQLTPSFLMGKFIMEINYDENTTSYCTDRLPFLSLIACVLIP
ncbi:hypothetical protein SAMN05421579_102123 [Xenorhabdus japonica]|uniref:Uncharacterized protein n=1 Tax=Xenorhabdus japonica TaxID=53341 RepID=A0A1I4YNI2_9GAMM|nr:hypothetical protein SAMN05421579_102123 [Xenorhabdus japonica]